MIISLVAQTGWNVPEYMTVSSFFQWRAKTENFNCPGNWHESDLMICDEIVSTRCFDSGTNCRTFARAKKNSIWPSHHYHDLSLVRALSDRIYVMYLGRLLNLETQLISVGLIQRALVNRYPHLTGMPIVILQGSPSFTNMPVGCSFRTVAQ